MKARSNKLFSWKTRGQYDLDAGKISALAGLQKPLNASPEEVREWVLENIANPSVKASNTFTRWLRLDEVYKGAPFGKVTAVKYISTQYDFKRRPIHHPDGFVASEPWKSVEKMKRFIKLYVNAYPNKVDKVDNAQALKNFEVYTTDVDKRLKAERARKRRLERELKVSILHPRALKLCVRLALHGDAGFKRGYSYREIIDFLFKHGIKDYRSGGEVCAIDSNFLKNQKRLDKTCHRLPLTPDVFQVLKMFTKLDEGFKPGQLLLKPRDLAEYPPAKITQLACLLPNAARDEKWAVAYYDALQTLSETVSKRRKDAEQVD